MRPVWRDLDQAELDRQYNSRGTVADFSVYTRQYAEQTLAAKRTLKCVENLSYGDGVEEKLDIYRAAQVDAPVMVFFHGGDWRALSKEDSGFAAPAFVAAGVTLVPSWGSEAAACVERWRCSDLPRGDPPLCLR